MAKHITIWTKATGLVKAEISSENQSTADSITKALPIHGKANRWGDEIYFSTPVKLSEEHGREEVEVGSIAYWPPGKAICIFFGPTPASRANEPRAASPVNVFAKVTGDARVFEKVKDGDEVKVEISEQ